jgi:hypothetical protein
MKSALKADLILVGTVEAWGAGCGHIVTWDGWPLATELPNANVHKKKGTDNHGSLR